MPGAWRKSARILSTATGAIVLAALGLALALPVLVDRPRMKAELQLRLSSLVHGTMSWDELHLQLLPVPKGVMSGLRLEVPPLLQARAETLEAQLKFWPLLRGRVEVNALTAVGADVRLAWAPAAADKPAAGAERAPDPVAAVRAAAGAAARALQEFAPDTQLAIRRASVDLRLADLPPLQIDALEVQAHSAGSRAQLQVSAAGRNWKRLSFEADFDYELRSGRARLEAGDLDPQAWIERIALPAGLRLTLAPLTVRAELQADGTDALTGQLEASTRSIRVAQGARINEVPGLAIKTNLRADAHLARVRIDELRAEDTRLLQGTLEYAYASREASGRFDLDLDAARALGLARRVLAAAQASSLQEVETASGRLRGSTHFAHRAGQWSAGLQLRDADVAFRLQTLPWALRLSAGTVEWQAGLVDASGMRASAGGSSVAGLAARLRLDEKGPRLESAGGKAILDLDELYPWLRSQPALADTLRRVAAVNGTLEAVLLKASGRPAAPDFDLRLLPRRVRIQADALPGPLSVDGGAVRLTRSAARMEQVTLGTFDARAMLSGSASGLGTRDFRVRARLADGSAGPQALGWVLGRAQAPSQLALRTPFAFAADQLDWGPGRRLEARARVRFDEQATVAANLTWQPGVLDLRQLQVEDAHGVGTLAVLAQGKRIEGRFEGSLHGAVLRNFLKEPGRFTGSIAGDVRFAAETDRLRHASVEGRLRGEGVDLAWLAGRPLRVEKFALEADHDTLRIGEAVVRSGKSAATLRGELRRGPQGPIVDATIESDGVALDELLPVGASAAPVADQPVAKSQAEAPAAGGVPSTPAVPPDAQRWWPLPITGRVAMRAGFIQHKAYRVSPVAAALMLEAERARLEVQQAQLCGIALPFVLEARPGAWSASARIAAAKQPVNEMARCLTGEQVQITGNADLAIELRTQGRGRDLLRNLEGSGRFEARDGRMQKFELIGNILSLLSIEDLATTAKDAAEGAKGFRYRRIAAAGRLQGGRFTMQEGVFESPSASMAAHGTVRLADGDTQMTVLVAPFGRVNRVARGIPVFGYVIGGTLTSIPVGVSGDIRSPLVVPLGPRAVTQELLGVFERTITLPGKLAEPPVSK